MGRSDGHPWGDPAAATGDFRWPPTGRFPWPPSHRRGVFSALNCRDRAGGSGGMLARSTGGRGRRTPNPRARGHPHRERHPRRTWARLGRVGSPRCRDQSSTSACATPWNAPESPVEGSYHAGVRSRDAAGRPDRAHAALPELRAGHELSNPDDRSVDTHRGQRRGSTTDLPCPSGGDGTATVVAGVPACAWRSRPPRLHRPPGHGPGGGRGTSDDTAPCGSACAPSGTPQNSGSSREGGQHGHH